MKNLINGACLLISLLAVMRFVTIPANSTEGDLRDNPCPGAPQAFLQGVPCAAVSVASESYARSARRILQTKCYDCHGVVERIPLYSKVPPVKGLVENDIRRAKKNFNMSAGFPFTGKKDFLEDLRELREVVEEGRMPPQNYRLMHWGAALTPEEEAKILAWAKNTENALRAARAVYAQKSGAE